MNSSKTLAVTTWRTPSAGSSIPPQNQRPRSGGKVYVEKSSVLDDLITEVENTKRISHYRIEKVEPSPATTHDLLHNANHSTHHNTNTMNPLEKMRKARQPPNPHLEALEAMKERRERQFPVILANVDKANEVLYEVEKEMRLIEEAKYNKTRRQFEEWNANVHGKIQKNIQKQISEVTSKDLNKKKNEDYDKFLNVTNRKACIFRDIIIESEYDPLEPNRNCIKAKTTKLKDPVKISQIKSEEEASMLGGPPGKKQPLGKDTLNVELWAAGQIEATPYGTFAKMMNKKGGEESPQTREKNATLRSNIHMDHFGYPRTKDAIDAEMPRGKRIYPEVIYTDPGRIFGNLPPDVEREIASIRPPENRRTIN